MSDGPDEGLPPAFLEFSLNGILSYPSSANVPSSEAFVAADVIVKGADVDFDPRVAFRLRRIEPLAALEAAPSFS